MLALVLLLLSQSPDAQCHQRCGQAMDQCLKACQAQGNTPREKAMACLKRCGDQQEPCLDACDRAGKKK
ncbi:MAG: hypothetical protein K1X89_29605 [Myxococcaceae bacterium]|nr:hypothetical protein [Myxococcaceae bacterium]